MNRSNPSTKSTPDTAPPISSDELAQGFDELLTFLSTYAERQAEWDEQTKALVESQTESAQQLRDRFNEVATRQLDLMSEIQKQAIEGRRRHLDALDVQLDNDAMKPIETDQTDRIGEVPADVLKRLEKLEAERDDVQARLAEVQELEERTREQRRRLADKFLNQRSQLRAAVGSIGSAKRKHSRTTGADTQELEELKDALIASDKSRRQIETKLEQAEAEIKELKKELANAEQVTIELVEENRQLREQAPVGGDDPPEPMTSDLSSSDAHDALLQQIDELREELDAARAENSKLQTDLAKKPRSKALKPTGDSDAAMDWESQKKLLIAQLEDEEGDERESEEEPDEERAEARLQIQEVIETTDRIIKEKDTEIAELKHLLNQQSESIGEVAVGAAAIADIIDEDELIQEERKNLQQLQEEWREKLRSAEVEVSLERAKLARERSELEAMIESIKKQQLDEGEGGDDKKVTGRGRWLERLGLRDDPEV